MRNNDFGRAISFSSYGRSLSKFLILKTKKGSYDKISWFEILIRDLRNEFLSMMRISLISRCKHVWCALEASTELLQWLRQMRAKPTGILNEYSFLVRFWAKTCKLSVDLRTKYRVDSVSMLVSEKGLLYSICFLSMMSQSGEVLIYSWSLTNMLWPSIHKITSMMSWYSYNLKICEDSHYLYINN